MYYFILILILGINLYSQSKVALLIGNTEYEKVLKNPINDIEAIKKTLLSIGFEKGNIEMLKNASKEQIEKTLFRFNKKASQTDISFIYFSGHGMQSDNKNYLFPANTKVNKSLDLRGLVDLDFLIQSASSAKYGIVLVDACRNNPLVSGLQKSGYRGSILKKGLGQIKAPKRAELIIGFATEADNLANDGIGNNSPYVKALIKNLRLNLDIRNVLGQVGLDVSKATNNEQNPILKSTLGRESVCLTGNCNNRVSETYRPKPKIEDNRDEVNSENYQEYISVENSLIFEKKPSIKKYSWNDAIRYCKNHGSNQEWRLPTRSELKRLSKSDIYTFDTSKNWEKWFSKKYRRDVFFENSIFWSSTSYSYSDSGAWFIDFSKGYEDWKNKNSLYHVICVKN